MTISNFFFTAAYALWLYILLCYLGKLLLDRRSARRRVQSEALIRLYFQPEGSAGDLRKGELQKFASSMPLVCFACRCYLRNLPNYSQQRRDMLEGDLFLLLHAARKKHPQDGALLDRLEACCAIPAERSRVC